jgi:hypothetical protein
MLAEPQGGACNACLFLADDHGDNSVTIRCQLAPDHKELHQEQFERAGALVTITWIADERVRCDHGCGQWRHDHQNGPCPRNEDDHAFSDCAYCHPGEDPHACPACGKTYYWEAGHKHHCSKAPFTCATCGESGIGPHDWPSGCPKAAEMLLARGVADECVLEDIA